MHRRYVCSQPGCQVDAAWGKRRCETHQNEPSLFDTAVPSPSLEEVRLREQQLRVFAAVCERNDRHPGGANAWEVQCWLVERGEDRGIQRNAIGSRFAELTHEFGFLELVGEREGPSARMEDVYAPTPRGLEWRRLNSEGVAA